jgi:hypothetical protein
MSFLQLRRGRPVLFKSVLLLCACVPCSPRIADGLTVAIDNAANAAYAFDATGAWKGLNPTTGENPPGIDNGGTGFNTWNFAGGYQQPQYSPYGDLNHFIDGVDFSASTYNNLGAPAFSLTNSNVDPAACPNPANCPFGGETSRATRVFSQPLAVGNTVSLQFDNPAALTPALPEEDRWFPAGIFIQFNSGSGPAVSGSTGVKRFELYTSTGTYTNNTYGTRWYINDGSTGGGVTPTPTGVPLSTTASGAQLTFTLLSAETYSMQLKQLSNGAVFYSQTGTLANTGAGAIDTVEIALYGNGSGNGVTGVSASPTGQREFFFNNLRIDSPATVLTGDYNHNGVVDAVDYVIWRDTLGQSVSAGSGADGDNNGVIGPGDFAVWRSNFGALASGSSIGGANVAEPSSVGILVALTAGSQFLRIFNRRHEVLTAPCDGLFS